MNDARRFAKGSAVYVCRICGRKTRSTGRGDNENVRLCEACFCLGEQANELSDRGRLSTAPADVLALISAVAAKGGCIDAWRDLTAAAEAALGYEGKRHLTDAELWQCLDKADARKADGTLPIAVRVRSFETYSLCLREASNRGYDYASLKAKAAA